MNVREYVVTIRGTAPYVPRRFGFSAQAQIEETYRAGPRRGTKTSRPEFTPDAEAAACLYRFPDGGYGIPALAVRRAIIDAAPIAGYVKKRVAGAVEVVADGVDQETQMPLVRLKSPHEPRIFASRVVVHGQAAVRYRKAFLEWSSTFLVRVDPRVLDAQGLRELLEVAGRHVGLGEGRPGSPRSPGLGWGRFEVVEIREG